MKTKKLSNLRIIWAITAKDLTDSFKNKNVISVILPALVLIVLYRYIPILNSDDHSNRLRLYANGNETTAAALVDLSYYQIIEYDSDEKVQYGLSNEELTQIALAFPEGFDASVANGDPLPVQGYALDFFETEQIDAARSAVEVELESVLGVPVQVSVDTIPLQVESYGITVLTSLALTFGLIMVGMVGLPYIMLEEKDAKTIEVMMVSPAGAWHIVLAKALTGMFITLTVFAFSVIIYRQYFVHWWLLVLCGVFATAFAISIGLLIGILVDNRQKLTLYGWIFIVPLFVPMILVMLDDLFPPALIQVIRWFPSVAIMRVIRTSMAGTISAGYFLPQLGVVLACTALLLGLDTMLVRRMDR